MTSSGSSGSYISPASIFCRSLCIDRPSRTLPDVAGGLTRAAARSSGRPALGGTRARRHQLVRMAKPLRNLRPVRRGVEVDANPTADTDVGGLEVALGRARDQEILGSMRGLAPDRVASRTVVVPGVGEAREHLLARPEGRLA